MEELRARYRTPGHPVAFSGQNQVQRHSNNVNPEDFLSTVDSYTRHRQTKKPRSRNPVYVYNKRELMQSDLADVSSLSKQNDNTNFLLAVIDTYSRYAWIRPLKNKNATSVVNAMRSILNEMDVKPRRLFTDRGTEYTSKNFQDLLKEFNVSHTLTTAEVKAPHVERFLGTFKRLMANYMTEFETYKYLPQLDNLLETYNNRGHRGLGFMTPAEAELDDNRDKVLETLNKRYEKAVKDGINTQVKYKPGDMVRLQIYEPIFRRGHKETFTPEIFKIQSVIKSLPIVQYKVETFNGNETIEGRFYNSELQKVSGDIFKVERVIREKVVDGKRKLFVKWLYFSDEYNSWIDADDVTEKYA